MSRLSRRESRKRRRKEAAASSTAEQLESGNGRGPTIHEEPEAEEDTVTEAQTAEGDEGFHESQRQSLYSLPGAFRVSRKYVNNRQIEEIALEEVSIDSYNTTKTPPFVIPSASLVQESSRTVKDDPLPVALPASNVLFVTKRHVFICVMLSCIAFGGLFTGLLFALWQRPKDTTTPNSSLKIQEGVSPTTSPTLAIVDVLSPTLNPTTAMPQKFATAGGTRTVAHPSSPTLQPSSIILSTRSPTRLPTGFPTAAPIRSTPSPTRGGSETATPNVAPKPAGFSLTNRPTLASNATPTHPGHGNGNGNGNGNGHVNG